jgi:hypothetical protein
MSYTKLGRLLPPRCDLCCNAPLRPPSFTNLRPSPRSAAVRGNMKMGAVEDYPLACHRRPPTFCAYIRPRIQMWCCLGWRVSFALPMKSSDCHSAFINAAESRDLGLSLMVYLPFRGGPDLLRHHYCSHFCRYRQ